MIELHQIKTQLNRASTTLGRLATELGAYLHRQTWRGEYWQPRCYRGDEY